MNITACDVGKRLPLLDKVFDPVCVIAQRDSHFMSWPQIQGFSVPLAEPLSITGVCRAVRYTAKLHWYAHHRSRPLGLGEADVHGCKGDGFCCCVSQNKRQTLQPGTMTTKRLAERFRGPADPRRDHLSIVCDFGNPKRVPTVRAIDLYEPSSLPGPAHPAPPN